MPSWDTGAVGAGFLSPGEAAGRVGANHPALLLLPGLLAASRSEEGARGISQRAECWEKAGQELLLLEMRGSAGLARRQVWSGHICSSLVIHHCHSHQLTVSIKPCKTNKTQLTATHHIAWSVLC